MQALIFCDECGAANSEQAAICVACLRSLVASPAASPAPFTSARPVQVMARLSASGPLTPGSLLAARYRILKQIGRGGSGVVYQARDERQAGRLVAVKQIQLARLSPRDMLQATDSYNREITLQQGLRHKGIPRLSQHFTDAENWYLVMEYIQGETLEERLKQSPQGTLPLLEVLKIAIQLCDILAYLHGEGVIFRDVKPANIILTPSRQVYLIDFGIARRYDTRKFRDTMPLGSPGYAAPEQYGTAQSNAQTDIYGLGATLLTLLSGKDLTDYPVADALAAQELPPALSELLLRMLQKQATLRIDSVILVKWRLQTVKVETPGTRASAWRGFLLCLLPGCGLNLVCGIIAALSQAQAYNPAVPQQTASGTLLLVVYGLLFFEVICLGSVAHALCRQPGYRRWRGWGLISGMLLSLLLLAFLHVWPV